MENELRHTNSRVHPPADEHQTRRHGRFVIMAIAASLLVSSDLTAAAGDEAGSPLYVLKIDGGKPRKLAEVPGRPFLGSPSWSRNGRFIVFDAWSQDDSTCHVFVVDAEGGKPQGLGLGSMPCWSPDDRQITFFRHGEGFGLWVIDRDGGGIESLNRNGNSPRWSPDGSQIAFVRLGSNGGLAIFDPAKGTERLVLNRSFDMRHGIDWSPDGSRICGQQVLIDRNGVKQQQVYIVEVASGRVRVRLQQETGHRFAWSPNGKKILFFMQSADDENMQLYVLDPETNDPPERVSGQDPTRANVDPAWSPDGTSVVFASGQRN